MHRDTALGVDFTGVNYYDGQGFMVRKELVSSSLELDGASLHKSWHYDRTERSRLFPHQ